MNLSDAIDAYIAYRRATGVSTGTRRNEQVVLRYLLADVGNLATTSLRPQHIDTFWVKRTTWGPGTMNRARVSLNTFFSWCQKRNYIRRDMDLLAGSRRIRVPDRDRVIIPQSEFSTFIESQKDPRRRIIAAIGLYLFVRKSEIQILRWRDANFDSHTIEVFRPKTGNIDTLPLCEELVAELRRWKLAYAAKVGEAVQPDWYIVPGLTPNLRYGTPGTKGFVEASGVKYRPTSKANLDSPIQSMLKGAGYHRELEGGHTLRRSGAVALYNQLSDVGHDRAIRVCQAMLGHASIQTTEIYLRLDLDRKVRNDLLAGKPMFPAAAEGEVVSIEGRLNGQANTGSV